MQLFLEKNANVNLIYKLIFFLEKDYDLFYYIY